MVFASGKKGRLSTNRSAATSDSSCASCSTWTVIVARSNSAGNRLAIFNRYNPEKAAVTRLSWTAYLKAALTQCQYRVHGAYMQKRKVKNGIKNTHRYVGEFNKFDKQLLAASFAWNANSRCSNGILSHETPLRATHTSHSLA